MAHILRNSCWEKGYRVVGLLRRSASADVMGERLRWLGIDRDVEMRDGDLIDISSLMRVVHDVAPDEVYNLAAQSFVATSWQQPLLTGTVTGMGAVGMLEALRLSASQREVLSGLFFRNVRAGAGASAE